MKSLSGYTLTEALHERAGIATLRGVRQSDEAPVIVRLPAHEPPSKRVASRIRREWALLRELAFPGLPRPLALVDTQGNAPALVLEDPGGASLKALLAAGRLSAPAAVRIAASIALVLEGLHQRHAIHGEIEPAHVLVDPGEGRAHLAALGGAARLSPGSSVELRLDAPGGGLLYLAPEQTGRMNRAVDARADLYSLGVVLYEMLTGAPPFTGDPLEIVHAHLARAPAPLRDVPAPVEAIVHALLEKNAEDRYQSARGLRVDLERCSSQWDARGAIEPFPLGRHDAPAELRVPSRLHGRAAEAATLLEAFARASSGASGLSLVKGPAGIGKSTLVGEVRAAVARQGGHFASGKCDQRGPTVPAAPVLRALRDLARQILAEPAERIALLRERLRAGVGASAGVLVDLVPELSHVIGPQPPLAEVGAAEAQNRFAIVVQGCLRALCTAERPVVLLLEDLQWADPATVDLVRVVLSDRETRHLLVVLVYREEEVGPGHPLAAALEALAGLGIPITNVTLGALDEANVGKLVADTLGTDVQTAAPLAALLGARTSGNPFFVQQYLRALVESGLVRFDAEAHAWRWDAEGIRAAYDAGDVLELVTGRILRLSPEAGAALRMAACIGHTFDERTLAFVRERSPEETAEALRESIEIGLVMPVADSERSPGAGEEGPLHRFLHDRVQQAAYALIPEDEREAIHLRIGRRLRAQPGALSGERIFDVLAHIHRGLRLLDDPAERLAVAQLSLVAGRRAKARIAFEAARDHFAMGVSLLPADAWEHEHELAFALHEELLECESLNGHLEAADALFEALVARAQGDLERARVECRRVNLYVRLGRFVDAVKVGLSALARLSVHVSEEGDAEPEPRAIPLDLDAPAMTDPRALALEDLMLSTALPAYYVRRSLFGRLLVRWHAHVLASGHSTQSAYGYVHTALLFVSYPGRLDEAYAIGRFALALDEKWGGAALSCTIVETFAGNIAFFHEHVRSVLAYFPRAIEMGLAAGDLTHVAYVCCHLSIMRFCDGSDLTAVCEEMEARSALVERTRDALSIAIVRFTERAARSLLGRDAEARSVPGEAWDDAALQAQFGGDDFSIVAFYLHTVRLTLHVFHGRSEEALAEARLAEARSAGLEGQFVSTQLAFFAALARLGVPADEARADQPLSAHRSRLAALAEGCPENFLHMHLLVEAEAARVEGRHGDARERYDEAIDAARKNQFVHHEALACELAARYHLARGKDRLARAYLEDALDGHARWGARAKVDALLAQHPTLQGTGARAHDGALDPGALDVVAIVRAAEAISGEIELERLLDRLMRTVLEVAGADRGALVLVRAGELMLEALRTLEPDVSRVGLSIPLDAAEEVAASVVQYVARTRETVVLEDAAHDARFAADARFAGPAPASVLCLPLVHRNALAGVVYLENRAARGALSRGRVEVLSLLSSQAAIAVENALLVADVRFRKAELERANQALSRELAERARIEAERAAFQQAIIDMQRARLAEMSTPLIPISDGVMVMPLVGTLDAERAEHMLEVLLSGTLAGGARAVILDITGVKAVDEQVAGTLLRAVQALRLLGAETVITGVRGEVARALLRLGEAFEHVLTKSTLQAGVAYALGRVSGRRTTH